MRIPCVEQVYKHCCVYHPGTSAYDGCRSLWTMLAGGRCWLQHANHLSPIICCDSIRTRPLPLLTHGQRRARSEVYLGSSASPVRQRKVEGRKQTTLPFGQKRKSLSENRWVCLRKKSKQCEYALIVPAAPNVFSSNSAGHLRP